ncbi:hypothetical protein PCC9214_01454 [Planktothrix tepida]|uniref:Prepilin-type N-terminal cleavage/methylation domain-containing protein n=1 Tax=Planktothrix tepida PCC 9214 TaxID=671072 RepID=A0A1J1LGN6_9CYAN|nr:hypothetical protein [Planktothrix tepida]CAD5933609.1 hypothetical protein PCC9214_01454 [Planktothrix tepida]CUR31741.1 conserved hypothetical protein [Planktothrix tepida PCC 9214]
MSIFLKLLFKPQIRSSPAKFDQNYQVKGMTMIELLVGTVIAFIVITPLMGMVIGLLNDDQRESAKANTEEEIQSALDYIGEDVSQALYIYTNTTSTDPTLNMQIDSLKSNNFLPTTGTPILVFWKRKIVEDAVPVDTTKQPKDCTATTCNDTYVLSLVSYHLLPETDKTSIWCQPSGTNCPSRIVRYEISDGLKKSDGITYYTKTELGTQLESYAQENNNAYNPNFSLSKPLDNVTNKNNFPNSQVLVNYIEKFELDPSSTNDLAKLAIQGNALRRNDANATCATNSPYCPKSSVQLRGLSGLGN